MVIPNHVAIILDGNGRWAKKKGMPRTYGHVKGCENLEKICSVAKELGVKYLTVYAFSTENWKQFFSITVPMITPIIFYNLVTQICQAFQEFNGPFIITNGGPRGSTTLISILVYNYAFKSNQMGMASALAWIMFVIVCILTIIAFTSQKKWVYYSDER